MERLNERLNQAEKALTALPPYPFLPPTNRGEGTYSLRMMSIQLFFQIGVKKRYCFWLFNVKCQFSIRKDGLLLSLK
jgi:hypothetical protein